MEKKRAKKRQPDLLPFKRFAAIDFETADCGRDSACALAVVVVDKGNIIHKGHHLVRPPRRDFVFTYLHGISWDDVRNKPDFKGLWPKLRPLFKGVDFIAAHNASFDKSVLHACCESAAIEPLKVRYLCTMKLARRQWGVFPTKLPDVCRYFGFQLKHYEAASDALACAKIVLQAQETGVPAGAFLKN